MQSDLLVAIMALIAIAVLLLYCMQKRRKQGAPPTATKTVPVSTPIDADETDSAKSEPLITSNNNRPVEEEPMIAKQENKKVQSQPPSKPKTEVDEAPFVSEEMVKATHKKIMFAETERTQSLFEMFENQDVQDVAKEVSSLDEVSALINRAGVERCNLIFGIDYTGSNYLQGKKTFGGKCLHNISATIKNPYQNVIQFLGETLEPFHSDEAIPAYGFGDAFTKDHSVFPLKEKGMPEGFQEVLSIYNQLTPKVRLGGPTNFAPLIKRAIEIVRSTRCYHILVIVADGQVTNERATTDAIVEASNYPLSIITVGVGDGPWDTMHDFDEKLPVRNFDNFHFVDYSKVTKTNENPSAAFALHALMEIPDQYKAIKKLQLLYD